MDIEALLRKAEQDGCMVVLNDIAPNRERSELVFRIPKSIYDSLRNAAHTGRHIGNNAVADGKDVEHNVHAVPHQGFGGHKADEIMHSSLRAFKFMEVGGVFEQRYGKEQNNQRIAYADHGTV